MFAVDTLLAITLLSASPDTPIEPGLDKQFNTLAPVLRQTAISWEIMDRRETHYVLARADELKADLQLLRKRYRELKDAPAVHDCVRFPSRKAISQMLAFNREYRDHLKRLLAVDRTRAWVYREAITETDRLYKIWDTIRDTRCEYYYSSYRRQALKKVVQLIGMEAFYNGNYPPHIPVWRFSSID